MPESGSLNLYPDLNAIRAEINARSFRIKRGLGQNFLYNHNLLELIIDTGEVGPGDLVLEIGGGPGCLTGPLLQAEAKVVSVEIDSALHEIGRSLVTRNASEKMLERITWIQSDFLEGKHKINPRVEEVLRGELQKDPHLGLKVISNLPYSVATPSIINIMESGLPWEKMILMVQDEVADRIVAGPGTRAYGQVSVIVAAFAEALKVKKLGSGAFWPQPEVDSQLIKIIPGKKRFTPGELPYNTFKGFLRAIFAHKRKTWLKSLKTCYKSLKQKDLGFTEFTREAEKQGTKLDLRAQDLDLEQIRALAQIFSKWRKGREIV